MAAGPAFFIPPGAFPSRSVLLGDVARGLPQAGVLQWLSALACRSSGVLPPRSSTTIPLVDTVECYGPCLDSLQKHRVNFVGTKE